MPVAHNSFKIRSDYDLCIIFFVGIGDAIYGLPALLELKKIAHSKNHKFHAFVEEIPSNFANPSVYHLLKSFDIFDTVSYFHGRKIHYWKYYDWSSVINKSSNTQYFPFIYNTNSNVNDRVDEIFKQFSLTPNVAWPKLPFTDNKNLDSLYPFFEDTSYLYILLHLETRSGNYVYPYLDQVLDLINNSKIVTHNLNLLVFSTLKIKSSSFFINNNKIRNFGLLSQENHNGESYEFTVIKTANKNNIIIVDPKKYFV